MRAVVTRVTEASVTIDGAVHGRIGKGFFVLLGVHTSDTEAEARKIADKICGLRVFEDSAGKMNVNPADAGAALLNVVVVAPKANPYPIHVWLKGLQPGRRPPYRSMSWCSPNAAAAAFTWRPASSARICRSRPSTTGL